MNPYDNYQRAAMQARDEANVFAAQLGLDPSTAHLGTWDAFRHAYVSAEITRQFGSAVARLLGDFYEMNGLWGDPRDWGVINADTNMDAWNNYQGRVIGGVSQSREDSALKIYEAIQDGRLIEDLGDTRQFNPFNPSQSGKFNASVIVSDVNPLYSRITQNGVVIERWYAPDGSLAYELISPEHPGDVGAEGHESGGGGSGGGDYGGGGWDWGWGGRGGEVTPGPIKPIGEEEGNNISIPTGQADALILAMADFNSPIVAADAGQDVKNQSWLIAAPLA